MILKATLRRGTSLHGQVTHPLQAVRRTWSRRDHRLQPRRARGRKQPCHHPMFARDCGCPKWPHPGADRRRNPPGHWCLQSVSAGGRAQSALDGLTFGDWLLSDKPVWSGFWTFCGRNLNCACGSVVSAHSERSRRAR